MILVDSSVWIDHLRQPVRELNELLRERNILCHEMVIGELACGNLRSRDIVLHDLKALPALETLSASALLALIEDRAWMGRGIGYVDANLLGSVMTDDCATLWTSDMRLRRVADELGKAYIPQATT